MLIRVRGGREGIKEYLEHGAKQGREFTRDELDRRVILDGDLELTDEIISSMRGSAQRYLHITLAFREDEISQDVLESITQDFKDFAFSAFDADELNFYAEAHLPRIKSYVHQGTGALIERKPHIHVVIPERNLLSGRRANPFGKVDLQERFLEAFQEHANNKYGLASPKDHRRLEFNINSEIVSRNKGDLFNTNGRELKERLLVEILERDITRYDNFKEMLAEHGVVRARNAGKANEYMNIKPAGFEKGVNLKEMPFSREFIELNGLEKRKILTGELEKKYEVTHQPRQSNPQIAGTLREWHTVRAKELKYINSGNRALYQAYRGAELAGRQALLGDRESAFYTRHRKETDYDRNHLRPDPGEPTGQAHEFDRYAGVDLSDPRRIGALRQSYARALAEKPAAGSLNQVRSLSSIGMVGFTNTTQVLLSSHAPDNVEHGRADRVDALRRRSDGERAESHGRRAVSLAGYLAEDLREHGMQHSTEQLNEFAEIKRNLDAARLMAHVAKSHGVIPDRYEITQGKDGSDRIKCGTRSLNVADFLTKELNLPFKDAAPILRECYAAQHGHSHARTTPEPKRELWEQFNGWKPAHTAAQAVAWKKQVELDKQRRDAIRQAHRAGTDRLKADSSLSRTDIKAAKSLLSMEKALAEKILAGQIATERAALKAEKYKPRPVLYRDFLVERAQLGDENALAELRQMRPDYERDDQEQPGVIAAQQIQNDHAPILPALAYQVDRNGNVTYQIGGRSVIQDAGHKVRMLERDNDTIETGLRLAVSKFGRQLDLTGDDEFKLKVVETAVATGLNVEFTAPELNEYKIQLAHDKGEQLRLAALGRTYIDQKRLAVRTAVEAQLTPSIQERTSLKHNAVPANVAARYTGEVIDMDDEHIYQRIGHKVISHDRRYFKDVPHVRLGEKVRIRYQDGKAKLAHVERGRTR